MNLVSWTVDSDLCHLWLSVYLTYNLIISSSWVPYVWLWYVMKIDLIWSPPWLSFPCALCLLRVYLGHQHLSVCLMPNVDAHFVFVLVMPNIDLIPESFSCSLSECEVRFLQVFYVSTCLFSNCIITCLLHLVYVSYALWRIHNLPACAI